ncbi:AraC family transcriptional regulator [Rhodanobacter sp. BL-MT-08]
MIEDLHSAVYDPLSTALIKMKLNASINVALDAGGKWAMDFPAYDGFTLNVVQKGECWLALERGARKVRLRAGDCFLLTGGRTFTLASDLDLKKRFRAENMFTDAQGGLATCNGGGDFFVAGTIFRFEGHLPSVLFARLPPVIHIDGGSDQAAVLRWSLERFGAELRTGAVGRSLMLSHLAPIMLLQILRIYLSSATHEENWLVALSHPLLAPVFEAMQTRYEQTWTLEAFAAVACMSRSAFSLTFKKKVGVAPMVYLMHWRMQIACELLQTGNASLSAIAASVGYGSESAFSAAFFKVLKCRPGAYRDARKY